MTGTRDEYAISKMVLVACWLATLAINVLILGLVATPIAFLERSRWNVIYWASLGTSVILVVMYMGLAVTLRCPACRRRFLIEWPGPKHSAARKPPFGHWGTTVRDVVTLHQFTCMHCGTLCRVK